jgi:multiple sugar transport system substrate-binding protein
VLKKLLFLCLVGALASTFAFASGQAATEKVTLTYWLYGGAAANIALNHKFVDQWNAANPNIQVVITDQVWDTVVQHFQTAAMAGSLPDAARIHAQMVNNFGAKGGYLEPLDNFADWATVKAKYVAGLLDACSFGGKYWGLPDTPILFAMLANKAVFDKAGVAKPNDATWTWKDFQATAKALTKDLNGDGTIDQYGYGIMGGELGGHAYRVAPFAFLAGGVAFNNDMTKAMFNTQPWIDTVQMLADMNQKDKSIDPGYLSDAYGDTSAKFASGRIAMSIEGPWYPGMTRGTNPNAEIWTLQMPKPAKVTGPGVAGTLSDGSAQVIAKSSKNKQAAWKFLQYMRGPEFDANYINADFGGLPVMKVTYNLPAWRQFEGFDAYGAMAPTSRPWPYAAQLAEITRDVLATLTLKAIKGDITVADALAQSDIKSNEILARK